MNLLLWIVLGLVAGWISSLVMETNTEQGPLMDILVGVLGAVIGGFLFSLFGAAGVTGFNLYSLMVATIGAISLLWLRRVVVRST